GRSAHRLVPAGRTPHDQWRHRAPRSADRSYDRPSHCQPQRLGITGRVDSMARTLVADLKRESMTGRGLAFTLDASSSQRSVAWGELTGSFLAPGSSTHTAGLSG